MERLTTRWHWPEYLIEAAALGTFMISAAVFGVVLEHPDSPVHQMLPHPVLRRLLMGVAMGTTAMSIIYSPFGARSGAHMNPSTTVTFARLGKIARRDAFAYVTAQFAGGLAGLWIARAALRAWLGHPAVNYVATLPGPWGSVPALLAEVLISFFMMTVVLHVSNGRHARLTGLAAGSLVALYILIESPVSGMSMNPARSFAPAVLSMSIHALWIYFVAPILGMLMAAEVFVRRRGLHSVLCAKLNHAGSSRCIFHCRMGERHLPPLHS